MPYGTAGKAYRRAYAVSANRPTRKVTSSQRAGGLDGSRSALTRLRARNAQEGGPVGDLCVQQIVGGTEHPLAEGGQGERDGEQSDLRGEARAFDRGPDQDCQADETAQERAPRPEQGVICRERGAQPAQGVVGTSRLAGIGGDLPGQARGRGGQQEDENCQENGGQDQGPGVLAGEGADGGAPVLFLRLFRRRGGVGLSFGQRRVGVPLQDPAHEEQDGAGKENDEGQAVGPESEGGHGCLV
jgi:hypothetical protein